MVIRVIVRVFVASLCVEFDRLEVRGCVDLIGDDLVDARCVEGVVFFFDDQCCV